MEDADICEAICWEFRAPLQVYTPLAVLNQHCRRVPLDGIRIEYGHGYWIQIYRRTGMFAHIVGADNATESSTIGEVPPGGGDFLPFLKKYRAIIESTATPVTARIAEVRALIEDPIHARFAQALSGVDVGWVINQLAADLGVSRAAAESLFALGHMEAASVFSMSDQELRKVPKIGPKTLIQIRTRQGGRE